MICDRCESEIPDNSTSCEFCGNQIRSFGVLKVNPFFFPKKSVDLKYKSTTLGKRLANYLIDIISIMVIGFVVGMVIGSTDSEENTFGNINDQLFGYLLMFLYYFVMEYIWGVTFGKLITRTKTVSLNSGTISFTQALGRSLCRFIPFEPVSILFSQSRRCWHDRLTNTMVVNVE